MVKFDANNAPLETYHGLRGKSHSGPMGSEIGDVIRERPCYGSHWPSLWLHYDSDPGVIYGPVSSMTFEVICSCSQIHDEV